jgi:hypothetical protein
VGNAMAAFRFDRRAGGAIFPPRHRKFFGGNMDQQSEHRPTWSWWYLLFVVQFIAVLWPPFYNRVEPTFIGMPFFYWYQLLMVIIGAILTAIVYFATRE